ncbi:hypothetical protein [Kitasatospora sp. NPDC050543]|uniref:hypothetical protein n=1 Tax=Kitasatospora sp. NPDC050543 TaxID=3364054 RepID=UPI0037AA5779
MSHSRIALCAVGAAVAAVLTAAPVALAGTATVGGASAKVSPSTVAPGGSFTISLDCSAFANPSPTPGEGQGLQEAVKFKAVGGGKFEGTGKLAAALAGAKSVTISGHCLSSDSASAWTVTVTVAAVAAQPTGPAATGAGIGADAGEVAAGAALAAAAVGGAAYLRRRRADGRA